MRITRDDGYITVEDAAELCGVDPKTVRNWITRGYGPKDDRKYLPVSKREGRLILLDVIEVAKVDHATAKRARRIVIREPAPEPIAA